VIALADLIDVDLDVDIVIDIEYRFTSDLLEEMVRSYKLITALIRRNYHE
jgi:hypothetical protein